SVFLAGYTDSPDFPITTGCYDPTPNGGRDVFLAKLDDTLTNLLAATFLGGSGHEGWQWPKIDLALAEGGDLFVAGLTRSVNFPATPGAFDVGFTRGSSGGDPFVARLDATLSTLVAATYLGGGADEWRISLVVDNNTNVLVTGETLSANYPVVPTAYDPGFNGGSDIFVTLLPGDLTSLLGSTFLGHASSEEPLAIALDNADNVCLAGYTMSPGFPTTPGAYDTGYNGGLSDGYVAKLDHNLTTLVACTLLGGYGDDKCRALSIDSADNIFVSGSTASNNFPTTPGAYDEGYNGGGDAFVSRLQGDLAGLTASTFLGGSSDEKAHGMTDDPAGGVYVTGYTSSVNFPTTPGAFSTSYNGGANDCFVTRLDGTLTGGTSGLPVDGRGASEPGLFDNQPNPFSMATTFRYRLPEAATVTLRVFDLSGRIVATIVRGSQSAGDHEVTWDAGEAPPGVYFCRIHAGRLRDTRMITRKP
ncbi:MAG: T9SS type A sorting domain-containing protein, partial [bacterium]|nr:T9SS type A sorting domain-containing protein [bacterium]